MSILPKNEFYYPKLIKIPYLVSYISVIKKLNIRTHCPAIGDKNFLPEIIDYNSKILNADFIITKNDYLDRWGAWEDRIGN